MKRFFYLLGIVLFSACALVSCKTNLNSKVRANISEESQVLFSGESQTFYATLTGGMREEPYKLDGISNKLTEFSVVSIAFLETMNLRIIEFEITIDGKASQHMAEKNFATNAYMFDLEKRVSTTSQIEIETMEDKTALTCKSNDFAVQYQRAIEKGTEYLEDELNQILQQKCRFEVFLKLACNMEKHDDVFVWFFILKSDCEISANVVIDTMDESVYSKM